MMNFNDLRLTNKIRKKLYFCQVISDASFQKFSLKKGLI